MIEQSCLPNLHALSKDEVLQQLDASGSGLSAAESSKRLAYHARHYLMVTFLVILLKAEQPPLDKVPSASCFIEPTKF